MSTLFDLIVKRGAKILGSSEADFLELCVVNKAEELVARHRGLEALIEEFGDDEIAEWVTEAAGTLRSRLNKPKKKEF